LDPQKLDILSLGPIAEGMINQQTIFIYSVVSINRNIVRYNISRSCYCSCSFL